MRNYNRSLTSLPSQPFIPSNGGGASRDHPAESTSKLSEETKHSSDDISSELKTLESATQHTEPYQMPQLGNLHGGGNSILSSSSAMSILSCSAAFKKLEEKV